jgi:Transposase DDE domain
MTTIPHLSATLQTLLGPTADAEAKKAKFVQRRSKLSGATFTQTLVFGCLEDAQATLEDLSNTALALGVEITPQGLDQRFSQSASEMLKGILDRAIEEVIASDPVAIPVLQRFTRVVLVDSSTIALPEALATIWAGCGNQTGQADAALKIHLRLDLLTGALDGPVITSGRTHDRSSAVSMAELPPGSLRLADLGYFCLNALQDMTRQGVYWLSRIQANTAVFDATGQRRTLSQWLSEQAGPVDMAAVVGAKERVPCRLLAQRVPDDVAEQRRRRMRDDGQRRGQPVSAERLRLAGWTIYVTNASSSLLTVAEAMVLGRVRWQIELLFKLWKSHGRIDESRSAKPWHVLCDVYARVLAMLVQHWLLLFSSWRYADRSLSKAAKVVRKHIRDLEMHFSDAVALPDALAMLVRCLNKGCRINKSKRDPRTYQLLQSLA